MLIDTARPEDRAAPRTPAGPAPHAWPQWDGVTRRFEPAPPSVAHERILRIQGYTDFDRVRPPIRRAAEAMAAMAEKLSRPCVAWRHAAVRAMAGELLELEDGALRCPAFGQHLAGCTGIVPFVLTVGEALPARVVELVEAGDLLEGLLLESAGWLAVEDATRQFKGRLRGEAAARGARITSRMGPGYAYKVGGATCSWSLEDHPALFALFGDAELPVRLMASCAMSPKMSRSGLYGIAPVAAPHTAARPAGRFASQPASGRSR